MNTQCPTFIYCKFIEGYWTFVHVNMHHNHECNSLRYDDNPWMRRLTNAEFKTEQTVLISGTAAFNIVHLVYQSCRKHLDPQDVFNRRHKFFSPTNLSCKQYAYLYCKR